MVISRVEWQARPGRVKDVILPAGGCGALWILMHLLTMEPVVLVVLLRCRLHAGPLDTYHLCPDDGSRSSKWLPHAWILRVCCPIVAIWAGTLSKSCPSMKMGFHTFSGPSAIGFCSFCFLFLSSLTLFHSIGRLDRNAIPADPTAR